MIAAFVCGLSINFEEVEEVCDHFMQLCGVDGRFFHENAGDVVLQLWALGQGQAFADHPLDGRKFTSLSR